MAALLIGYAVAIAIVFFASRPFSINRPHLHEYVHEIARTIAAKAQALWPPLAASLRGGGQNPKPSAAKPGGGEPDQLPLRDRK
jgi:hypothetical protein